MSSSYYIKALNQPILLAAHVLAAGGEGELFEVQQPTNFEGYVAKILYPHKRTPQKIAKINYLVENPPFDTLSAESPIAWPSYALHNNQDEFVGYLMPKALGRSLEVLCSPRLPKKLPKTWHRLGRQAENALRLRLKVCFNIAAAVQQIHHTGKYVLVDLKPDNVLIQSNGLITLVDTDSVEVVEKTTTGERKTLFAASVTTPEYTPNEYYKGVKPTKTTIATNWDDFSLAVIFYRILYGVHPFAATTGAQFESLTSLGDKIKEGLFVHNADLQAIFAVIPPPHRQFYRSETSIQQLFRQAFIAGINEPTSRPSAQKWMQVLANHPLLLTNRNLPSKKISIDKWQEKNWYELAVEKLRREKGLQLNAATQNSSSQSPTIQLEEENLWEQVVETYSKFFTSPRKVVGFFIVLMIGIVTKWLLPVVITLAFLPLLLISFKSVWKYYGKQLKVLKQKTRKSLAYNSKKQLEHWEEMQYSYYTERTELRKQIKKLKENLNQLNISLKIKEKAFYTQNEGKIINFARKIRQQITEEIGAITEEDQQAKNWMKEEAQSIQQLKNEVLAKMQQTQKFQQITGEMPLDKLETIRKNPTSIQEHYQIDNIQLALIESELQALNEDYQASLLAIKKDFDYKHKMLEDGTQDYKIKIEDILKKSVDNLQGTINIEAELINEKYKKTAQKIKKYHHTIGQKTIELQEMEAKLQEVKQKLSELRS